MSNPSRFLDTRHKSHVYTPRLSQSCVVLDYNYTAAASMGYEEAIKNPGAVGGGDGNRTCTRRDFEAGEETIVTEVSLYFTYSVFVRKWLFRYLILVTRKYLNTKKYYTFSYLQFRTFRYIHCFLIK